MNFNNNSSGDFYAGIMVPEFKIFFLTFHILISFIAPGLLYCIIWYERFSSAQTHQTMINLILSHTCWISIARCFIGRIPYVVILFLGPFSSNVCNLFIFSARYFFLCVFIEIFLWQAIKFLFIFQWKHMAALSSNFIATFITIWNLFFSAVFILTTQMLEFHNAELDYHICTGKHPHVNINQSHFIMTWIHSKDIPKLSLEYLTKYDPLWLLTQIICLLLLIATSTMWVYSRQEFFKGIMYKLLRRNLPIVSSITNIESVKSLKFEQFNKAKNAIIGASGTFAAILLILILLLPSIVYKSYAKNVETINYGEGRFWTCVNRITIPILFYCVLPTVVISGNAKMRKVIFRQLKDQLDRYLEK